MESETCTVTHPGFAIIYSPHGDRLFLCRLKYTSRNYSSGLIEVVPAANQKSARDRDVRNEQANDLWNRDVMPFFKQLKIEKIIYGFSIDLSLFYNQFDTWYMNFRFQTCSFFISFWIIFFKIWPRFLPLKNRVSNFVKWWWF